MATTTTIEPKSAPDTSDTTKPVDTVENAPSGTVLVTTANSALNKELAKQYGIAILSAAIAIFAFIMYRRGSWSRPVLSGMVIGAALLAVTQSTINIISTTKAKSKLNEF